MTSVIQNLSVAKNISETSYYVMARYSPTTHPHSKLTEKVIGIAIKVHKKLGPGFREKYYQRAMYLELQKSGLKSEREKKVKIVYNKVMLGYHIIDFIIEKKVVLELKSMSALTEVEVGQLSKYLKLTSCKIGLLLNFARRSWK